MNKKVIVALGFSLIFFGALAQKKSYSQQFYNQLDGLMSQTVNSVEMVESGHLLVATTNGVFLFDGHRFFRPKYHEYIESRRIDDISKINESEFLMLGGNPNCAYYIKKGQLVWKEPIEGARNIKQLVSFNARTNTLYKRSGNKIFYKSPGQAQWLGPLASSDSLIISFINDNKGALYFWNGEELVYQDRSIKRVLYAAPGRADLIWKYHVARDERVLCWTQDSIFEFRSGIRVREAFYEIPDELVVRDVCEFQDGSFWYATQGSEILEYSDGVVTGHLDDFNLNGLQITSAFRDLNGTLWLGTIGKGLLKIQPSKSRLVQNSVDVKVNALADDGEHLLVGTSKGIYSLGKSGLERLRSGRDFAHNLEDVFSNNYTHQLRFSENHWVISTMRTRLQEHRNVFISEVLGKRALIRNCPSMDLHNGSLYLGFWGSFSVFAPPYTSRRSNIRFDRENIKLGRTNLFVPIEGGVITVCDYTVFLTSKQGESVDTFSVLGKDELGLNNTYLDLIVSGEKWFIATGNGVFKGKFNPEKRKLEEVEQISFSESQTICLIEEGPLWIGTSTGLLKYENEELSTVGLHKDLSQGKITTLFLNERNSILYVGTVSGLYEIDPKQKTAQDQMFKLYHYWIDHNGQIDTGASIVTLPYDGNAFSVNASFTSFLGTEEPVLRYSINGEEPVSANSTGFRVTALATGDHSLSLWGEANNGETTPKVEIGVTVLLPFWKSTQGILSFLAVGALLISLVVAIRLRTLKKQQATQRLLNELEKKALNLSLNPHFLFNSLNSIQSRLSQYKDEDLVNYVADFSDLMRKTLENSDKSGIPLENELAQLEKYLIMEQRRFKDKFSYIIDVPQEVQELELEIPPMLLQPFVENAIMHGILPSSERGEILIFSRLERGFLVFEIRDNGVGLKYKSGGQHVSKGIDITKKRVELLHEENMVEIKDRFDGLGSHGVTVTIKLKVDTT